MNLFKNLQINNMDHLQILLSVYLVIAMGEENSMYVIIIWYILAAAYFSLMADFSSLISLWSMEETIRDNCMLING